MDLQFTYLRSLSEEEKNVIREYTQGGYITLNEGLRLRLPLDQHDTYMLGVLDRIFANAPPIKDPMYVYRGYSAPSTRNFIKTGGFISATGHKATSMRFIDPSTRCCMMRILVPAGAKMLPIMEISRYPEEREVLISRHGILHATSKSIDSQGISNVDVVYIPNIEMDII